MKEVNWKVHCLSAIPVFRYCRKCGQQQPYISSGLFRVNAQRKNLDVWLIYKCAICDDTWNMTIHSRVTPAAIGKERLEQFYANDQILAQQYAMNAGLLKQNGVQIGVPEYEILGEEILPGEPTRVKLQSAGDVPVNISAVLRKKLHISRSELERLESKGLICTENGCALKKCRLTHETILCFNFPESKNFDGRDTNEN